MTVTDMQNLSDEELQEMKERADALLRERRDAARSKAVEDARALLEGVGLTFAEVAKLKGPKPATRKGESKRPARAGETVSNPADPSQTWNGRGRKPKWLQDAEAAGSM